MRANARLYPLSGFTQYMRVNMAEGNFAIYGGKIKLIRKKPVPTYLFIPAAAYNQSGQKTAYAIPAGISAVYIPYGKNDLLQQYATEKLRPPVKRARRRNRSTRWVRHGG